MKILLKSLLLVYLLAGADAVLNAQQTSWYSDLDKAYRKGLELFDNEQYVSARKVFDELLNQSKKSTDPDIQNLKINAQYYQAISALELLNPDGESLLSAFINEHPSHGKSNMAHFYLGKHYYYKKKYTNSIKHFEQVDLYDLDAEQLLDYKFQLGYDYFFKKNFNKSKRFFSNIKESEKYYYPAHYYYGYILYMEGKYEAALENLKKAGESKYFGQVVPFYVASIYYQQGNFDEAIQYAEPLLLNGGRLKYESEINQLLGKAYYEKKMFDKALPYLEYYADHSRKMEKEDIYQLAYCQYMTGDYKSAIDNFKELNSASDSLGQNAMYMLGLSYLKTGNKTMARSPLMEASQNDYDPYVSMHALFNYAKLSYELGYSDIAIRSINQFLNKYPDSEYSSEAGELLTDILISSHNYPEALKIIEKIKTKTPKIKEAYQLVAFYRGVELFNNKQYSESKKLFRKSLEYPIESSLVAQCYYWMAEMDMNQKNYASAINNYNKFLDMAGHQELPANASMATAYYGLGYAYMKKESYTAALSNFKRADQALAHLPGDAQSKKIEQKLKPDLVIRTADCQFMLNKKQDALANYSLAIDKHYAGSDYAYYQKGMILGLLNKPAEKINTLDQLTKHYPGSIYYDDALYQKANTYLIQNQYTKAIAGFEELMSKQGNSLYVVKSMLKLGLIYYNMNEFEKSVSYYQQVADEYANTPESNEAIDRVKDISIETGHTEWYDNMAGASLSEKDTVLFKSAERYYLADDCDKANEELSKYLKRFPNGYFAMAAHFYRADCYDRADRYKDALPDYEYVTRSKRILSYSEVAYLRAAIIRHYLLKDYQKAYEYYKKLLSFASLKANKETALDGLLITSFETKQYSQTIRYAKQIIDDGQSSNDAILDAHYYWAKVAYNQKDYETAQVEFLKTSLLTSTEKAAEAKYRIAEIRYKQGDLVQAEANCNEVLQNYSAYSYWLVKSYILIADIAVDHDELYQAKATLESIIDHYSGDRSLLNEAKLKLDHVNQLMKKNSRVKTETDSLLTPDHE